MHRVYLHLQVFLDGQAALEEEERKEEKAGKEFRRFNHRHASQQLLSYVMRLTEQFSLCLKAASTGMHCSSFCHVLPP